MATKRPRNTKPRTTRPKLERRCAELVAEIKEDLEAVNAYAAKHGSFTELVRAHYDRD